jgi:3-hydroxyisobutyrate dehydrogenase
MQDRYKLKLGWIGTGRMGSGMATRLVQGTKELLVWNRTVTKAAPLAAHGAVIADGLGALASCDVIFTMVAESKDLMDVLLGRDGLLAEASRKPRLIVDHSSISEQASAEIRSELAKFGVGFLCAPVSGNPKAVEAGKLLVIASGSEEDYRLVEPFLRYMGRGSVYVGTGERARIAKIAHNVMLGVVFQCMCEITVLAEKAGIPRHVFLDFINESAMGSIFTKSKLPVMTNLTFQDVTFTPKLLLKDMALGMESGGKYGVPMPLAAAAMQQVRNTVGRGYDYTDFAVMLIEQALNSGLKLEPEKATVSDGLSI